MNIFISWTVAVAALLMLSIIIVLLALNLHELRKHAHSDTSAEIIEFNPNGMDEEAEMYGN